ncbi:MAG: glutamate--tRNA ligase, partial [Chloroflexi bacterium]
GITHIFRGEDWLPSTPKHVLIFDAFGWTMPPIAHFPNVLGADNKKLSKRHGATKVEQFRADGYLPEAMINYLALIGWAPGTEEEIFSIDDLVQKWRIEQVQKAGGKFDRERLDWFNGVWIRKLTVAQLMSRLDPFVPAEWDRGLLGRAIPLIHERMRTLVEARDQIAFLFTDVDPDVTLLVQENDRAKSIRVLAKGVTALRALPAFDTASIKAAIEGISAEIGWKLKPVTLVIRAAVTGRRVGPPLYESLELLGREKSLARIARAEEVLGEGPRNA